MAENACHNLDDAVLADELGAVSAELRQLERRKQLLREAILQRGLDLIRGAQFEVPIVERTRASLDEHSLRVDMGDNWVEHMCAERPTTNSAHAQLHTQPLSPPLCSKGFGFGVVVAALKSPTPTTPACRARCQSVSLVILSY